MTDIDPAGDVLATRLRAAGCVFAEEEARLLREAVAAGGRTRDPALLESLLESLVERRVAGEPLETVLGWAELAGLRVHVAPGVFVPRRRSELLVRLALAQLPDPPGHRGQPGHRGHRRDRAAEPRSRPPVVVDVGCGSGALAAAVVATRPDVEVWALDVDPAAVACARRNLPPDRVLESDLFDQLPDHLHRRVDVVLANAPYVPTDEIALMPTEARDHEHRAALDGGPDGLDVQRRVAAGAPTWLRPDGVLVVETSRRQAPATAGLMAAVGLAVEVHTDDELDATAVLGTAHFHPR